MADPECPLSHLSPQKTVSFSFHLSEELVVEIFSWLPPESLIRFKCVSKSWYALINGLITDPKFVAKHLHNIKKNMFSPASLIVGGLLLENDILKTGLAGFEVKEVLSLLTIFNDDGNNKNHIHSFIEDLPQFNTSHVTTYHCNGIICLFSDLKTTMLWNPALMEVKFLPERGLVYLYGLLGMGFGYDCRAHDYKIISIASHYIYGGHYHPSKAEIYTLHNNCWREIKMPMLSTNVMHRNVYCKGVCYWLVQEDKGMILSFDMCDELFHTIPLPHKLGPLQEDHMNLMVWNDSVALLSYPGHNWYQVSIEIWIMNDSFSGGEGIRPFYWSKYQIVGPISGIGVPLMFWRNDELLVEGRDGDLVSYNLRTQKLRNIVTPRTSRISYLACSYVKSLVSLNEKVTESDVNL
ncbi:F-box domain containing protein [Parasponia andersonii]|uniref:F-box domain containing protein n=1 Tax=Parasponia andersonii TaxID=3476 RepID=A0A2P5AHJ3_PARAD|nr:F-box domain containing protein [Parasponia andersonii]